MKRAKKKVVRRRRKSNVDEVTRMLKMLPRLIAREEGPYTYVDRSRDFISVFSTEAGQRVLSQIANICDPEISPTDADKPGTLAYKAGKRRVMQEIMVCMIVKKPVIQETKDPRQVV